MKSPGALPRLSVLDGRLAVCRLDAASGIPAWAMSSGFTSFTRTTDELSVVCSEGAVPEGVACEKGWRTLKLEGPLDFSLVGVLAGITGTLAAAGISIFSISTYDTDYVLVKEESLETAKTALLGAGHEINGPRTTEKSFTVRPATEKDEPFLWEMLAEAAQEPVVRNVKENPGTSRYVQGWIGEGDLGFVAVSKDENPVGAAWLRLLTSENRGYGYLNDDTPELAIAVHPEHRGLGVGSLLLTRLLEEAGHTYSMVCLSVRADNPALRLYERTGFQKVRGSERTNNLANGTSVTMKRNLTDQN